MSRLKYRKTDLRSFVNEKVDMVSYKRERENEGKKKGVLSGETYIDRKWGTDGVKSIRITYKQLKLTILTTLQLWISKKYKMTK